MLVNQFHSSVQTWFSETFPAATAVQEQAWASIQQNRHTLIAAPTGSGKTLAAFLNSIDELVKQGINGQLESKTQVVYVSPLKALSNDIDKNLQKPIQGIQERLFRSSLKDIQIKTAVRTGDTPSASRTAMLKNPPHILVTTPESLYLLLTSDGGRRMLSDVHTLIIDEIHALVQDKRGSHLSISIERLQHLVNKPLKRIGLSATQKPIEEVAKYLVGANNVHNEKTDCCIVDAGHKRDLELNIALPQSDLTAIMDTDSWGEMYVQMKELIMQHKTTLIFVNTRRLAERLARDLTEHLGIDTITAHHGSMSREKRLTAEQRLKAGELKALIATASLELGIDIGDVELVCQIGNVKTISSFLQRVGRAGHSVAGTPKGVIFPLTRDDLVEAVALMDAIRRGELDTLNIPEKPLDILSQQLVGTIASIEEWQEEELYQLIVSAYPYRSLIREEFDEVLKMLVDGYTTRRGRRGAYIYRDVVNQKLRARKGARLTALTNAGAIPDNFDYEVILEPSGTFIGTINEDFAIESLAGDIFQLGHNSWKIIKVETGKVRVEDAGEMLPTIPFWLGEGPGRSKEFSQAVSRLRQDVSDRLKWNLPDTVGGRQQKFIENKGNEAYQYLINSIGVSKEAAEQVINYLAGSEGALGVMPTRENIVMERFFDEAGDMHVVLHAPFGSRMNRAWGLSLRKKFCRNFNFELQAAANENSIVLSLGATHSFPVDEVFSYLKSAVARDTLIQAVFDSPIFEIRWRWNASRSLAIQRNRAGKRVAPQLQRMSAEDLISVIFPDQLACLENIQGDREIPDHPLVRETIKDCLTEAMDIDELEETLLKIEKEEVKTHAIQLIEPSPLSQEILNAKPYAFLDPAPAEERRTRAIRNRRWLDPSESKDLSKLDPAAIELVKQQAWPTAQTEDELSDTLVLLGFLTQQEVKENKWQGIIQNLKLQNRVVFIEEKKLWVATERIPQWVAILSDLSIPFVLPKSLQAETWQEEQAMLEIIRGRLEGLGPVTVGSIVASSLIDKSKIEMALTGLENQGFVFRGNFSPNVTEEEWCERRLLHRINEYTIHKLRKEIQPVTAQDYVRFLFTWHGLTADYAPQGSEALKEIIYQLEGYEAAAAAWEGDLIPTRMHNYDPEWLDNLCLSGTVTWGRFRKPAEHKKSTPIKSSPVALVQRVNKAIWRKNGGEEIEISLNHNTEKVFEVIKQNGALFFDDIVQQTKLFKSQVEQALGELVTNGLVTSDSYTGLRALLTPSNLRPTRTSSRSRKRAVFGMEHAGRWSYLNGITDVEYSEQELEIIARTLLRRYGIVFRKLLDRENLTPKWRDLVMVYRRLEAQGEIRGGYFVAGMIGEHFALPEAVTKIRAIRKGKYTNQLISVSATDPVNQLGYVIPGEKIINLYGNRVLYKDGVAIAIYESGKVKFLKETSEGEQWEWQKALLQRKETPQLRAYLGKRS